MKKTFETTVKRALEKDKDLLNSAKIAENLTLGEYLEKNRTLLFSTANKEFTQVSGIDLGKLPPIIIDALLLWIVNVNRKRIRAGLPMIINYPVIKLCPIWKSVRMPFVIKNLTPGGIPQSDTMPSAREVEQGLGLFRHSKL